MAKRIGGKFRGKQFRVAGKKGAKGAMPSAEDMKAGMVEAAQMAAMQKKRGTFAKKRRRKARKGAY